ncbi:B3 domain-containing transcription factor VRN1 [Linum perenne]
MGSLLPVQGKKPRYSQLYVHDPTSEVDDRISQFTSPEKKLLRELVQSLQDMLGLHNVLARSFRQVRCSLQQPANRQLNLRISGSRVPNGRQYELPSGTDLAGLIPGDFEPDREDRDIIVNNSSTGSVRYMKQLFLDGMAICHYFGNPDLFITFTSNAQWPEITNSFIEDVGPCGEDKPSVVVRVFRMKLLHLKDDINEQQIFGRTIAGMHTVEFQKRGLPHVHILVWLAKEAAIDTTTQIDTFISAELPDPMIDPIGYAAATKFMLHGPCGVDFPKSPCMVDDRCKKFFPKPYTSETTIDDHGYAVYRRRMTGITAIKSDQCKDWSSRKNGFALGRIPSVPAACGDVFYLRILLGKIPGALSFQHLRTVNGVVYSDYQLACQAMGLLATDDEWDSVMLEVADPAKLLHNWWESMSEDFAYRQEQLTSAPLQQPSSPTLYNQVLHALNNILHTYSSSLGHFGLPMPTAGTSCMQATNIITAHLNYNCATEAAKSHQLHSSLNSSQLTAYAAIIESVSKNQGKFFFLHGHGGTGKTYLYNCIISKIRSEGKIVLVVASSGIAATLLPDGVTAHSRFKIPLEVDNLSTCMVKKGTEVAELLKEATLIVWDEAPMVHMLSFEAVDRTLCDLMNTPLSGPQYSPFGEKTVLLGGDFRQTLLVVPKGSREDNINASLPRSYLWNFCTLLHLHVNMRINSLPINTLPIFGGMQFSDWVLAIGNGMLPAEAFLPSVAADWITVPSQFLIKCKDNAVEQLIRRVYPSFQQSYQSLEYIKARAIVTPTNAINNLLVDQIPGSSKKYFNADSLSTTNANTATLQVEYPLEFLNSLSFNGVPEHILDLKSYVTVMLLRNINPAAGQNLFNIRFVMVQTCSVIHFNMDLFTILTLLLLLTTGLSSSFQSKLKRLSPEISSRLTSPLATLRVPSGDTWEVELHRDVNGILWITEGLTDFFDFYSVVNGYLLIFQYIGSSTLNAAVFSSNGSEIAYPIRGIPNGDGENQSDLDSE